MSNTYPRITWREKLARRATRSNRGFWQALTAKRRPACAMVWKNWSDKERSEA